MKALITGADGFIGSHLTELLVQEDFQVKALCQYNSFNDWGWLEDVDCRGEIEVVNGDIRDSYFCRQITKDVDIVFHLAALIAIPYSYLAPESYVDTNVLGTLNICQAALENTVKRVIHTSTVRFMAPRNMCRLTKNTLCNRSRPIAPQRSAPTQWQ